MIDLLHSPVAFADAPTAGWPASVVSGTDGTAEAREAVRQAAALAGPGGRLDLVTVTRGNGFPDPAADALPDGQRIALTDGIDAGAFAPQAATTAAGLIHAAAAADLLVVGCDALGPTPKAVLRCARCSVLLARLPTDLPLLDTILIGEESAPWVHERAARIAHVHGAEVRVVAQTNLPMAAAATGCGLLVTGDEPDAISLARLAPCSVLVLRKRT